MPECMMQIRYRTVCLTFASWEGMRDCCVGWTGEYCERNIDECDVSLNNSVPLCHHGGTCIDSPGSYTCDCTSTGYTGMCAACIDTAADVIVVYDFLS